VILSRDKSTATIYLPELIHQRRLCRASLELAVDNEISLRDASQLFVPC